MKFESQKSFYQTNLSKIAFQDKQWKLRCQAVDCQLLVLCWSRLSKERLFLRPNILNGSWIGCDWFVRTAAIWCCWSNWSICNCVRVMFTAYCCCSKRLNKHCGKFKPKSWPPLWSNKSCRAVKAYRWEVQRILFILCQKHQLWAFPICCLA